jgi:hypothetical protein
MKSSSRFQEFDRKELHADGKHDDLVARWLEWRIHSVENRMRHVL